MAIGQRLAALFYEIRAETSQLPGDLQAAERHLGKLTDFVNKHPVAAMGALATAMITVGVASTKMAQQVERSLEDVQRLIPGTTAQVDDLRDRIAELSIEQGRDQATLAAAAKSIAQQGAESLGAVEQRLTAAARAADATGAEIGTVINGLDQTLDLFNKGSEDSEQVLQRLFAVARGRMPLDDLFAALQAAAPTIRELNLDFDTAAAALGALVDQGLTAKQAAAEINALGKAGKEGRAEIERLAGATTDLTKATGEYNEAVRKAREESNDVLWSRTKNAFATIMIDLGQTILPAVNAELKGAIGLLDLLSGKVDAVRNASLLATLTTTAAREKMSDAERNAAVLELMRAVRNDKVSLEGVSPEQLQTLRGLFARHPLAQREGPAQDMVRNALRTIDEAFRSASAAAAAADAPAAKRGKTAEEIAAEIKKREEQQKAVNKLLEKENELREKALALIKQATQKLAHDVVDPMAQELRDLAAAGEKSGALTSVEAEAMRATASQLDLEKRVTEQKDLQTDLQRDLNKLFDDKDAAMEKRVAEDDEANRRQQTADEKRHQHVRNLITDIAQSADAALQLAVAFGVVDQKTGAVLRSVIQLGEGIMQVTTAITTMEKTSAILAIAAAVTTLVSSLGDVFGHPGQERARAFRAQLRAAREEWELMLAPLGDELADRSPLEQELVNLERQAEQMRRQAARSFLPQGERDPRRSMSIDELTAEAAAARRRGHHAGAEGIEAYRDALIEIEELFNAKEQLAGRRDAEQQRDAAAAEADPGTGRTTTGLAGLSYVHGDTLLSIERQILAVAIQERDILSSLLASITGQSVTLAAPSLPAGFGAPMSMSGPVTITNHITINVGAGADPAAIGEATAEAIDRSLHVRRMNFRAAAGAPRYS